MNGPVAMAQQDGVTIGRLSGDVDISRAEPIKVELLRAISNQDYGLVVDMGEVTYLDSAGVNVLFEVAERLDARQQALVAVVPDRALIQKVLTLVDASSVMKTCPTVDDAVAAVKALAPSDGS